MSARFLQKRVQRFLSPFAGFLLGTRQTLLETKDGGRTWEPRSVQAAQDEGFNYRFNSISFNGQEGWIVGRPAILLHTKDGGTNWERVPLSAKLPGNPVLITATSGKEGQAEMVTDAVGHWLLIIHLLFLQFYCFTFLSSKYRQNMKHSLSSCFQQSQEHMFFLLLHVSATNLKIGMHSGDAGKKKIVLLGLTFGLGIFCFPFFWLILCFIWAFSTPIKTCNQIKLFHLKGTCVWIVWKWQCQSNFMSIRYRKRTLWSSTCQPWVELTSWLDCNLVKQ